MMETFEQDIWHLMRGEAVAIPQIDVRLAAAESFMPITKVNMGYITCGVLINEGGEILMMQEAKRQCYGEWYLPAGRVEPGENLLEGVKREVKEETGLECQPSTLLMVEFGSGIWHRFTFTGQVTGGHLKTPKERDAESLQAQWMKMEKIQSSETTLRAFDIIKLIKCAQRYQSLGVEERVPNTLPAIHAHTTMVIRLLVVYKHNNQGTKYLVNTKNGIHLPSGMVGPKDRSSVFCCFRILRDALEKVGDPPKLCGLLTVEHCGIPRGEHDGLCYTLVLSYESNEDPPPLRNPDYQWVSIADDSLNNEILDRINKQRLVTFLDHQSSW